MISGDQILPRISSNVCVFPTEPEANPLQEWLDSCAMLKKLIPDDTLILPAHNEPFYGVKTRMQQLIDDHEDGLAKLLELCATPKRAVDVFPALFRTKITTGNYGMATGESLAHLNCLIAAANSNAPATPAASTGTSGHNFNIFMAGLTRPPVSLPEPSRWPGQARP